MNILYADQIEPYVLERKPVRPHGQYASGYGSKITTNIILRFQSENRYRRVYATCYSNCASYWIIYHGQQLYLHDTDNVK